MASPSLCLCHAGLTVDIVSTFYGVFVTQFVKLMLIFFGNDVLLFHCLVYRQNVTCPKCFTRYGHHAGDAGRVES